jgi:hypothetical protein
MSTFSHIAFRDGGKIHHRAYNDDHIISVLVDANRFTLNTTHGQSVFDRRDIFFLWGGLADVLERAKDILESAKQPA